MQMNITALYNLSVVMTSYVTTGSNNKYEAIVATMLYDCLSARVEVGQTCAYNKSSIFMADCLTS